MNILVTGSNGQMGSELRELVMSYKLGVMNKRDVNNSRLIIQDSKFFFTDKEEFDITNKDDIEKFVKEHKIDIIINCAAYTAVDKAEREKELADLVNHKAVKYLADIAKEKDMQLIHISTDYVFDGTNYKPYREDDKTNPQGVYGVTKLKGEEAFIESGAKGIIIRTSWVYSGFGNNFIKTMIRLGKRKEVLRVIYDQVGTPTYARDLAEIILDIIPKLNNKKVEIYNYSNEGVLSWYDFAKEIMKMAKIECKINPIETKDYPTPAKRPYYSVLNKNKIKKEFKLEIPYWKDSLDRCLKALGERK